MRGELTKVTEAEHLGALGQSWTFATRGCVYLILDRAARIRLKTSTGMSLCLGSVC